MDFLTSGDPAVYLLIAVVPLAVGAAIIWNTTRVKRGNAEYESEPSTARSSTVMRWIFTPICAVTALLSLAFALFSFQRPSCSVTLTPETGVACFKEGGAVEVVATALSNAELVSDLSRSIPAAAGEWGVVNTTDGVSIAYGTSELGTVDDQSLSSAGYYQTQSEIIGPVYVALTEEATNGTPLVEVSVNTVSRIAEEFFGVSLKVIEWYTETSDSIAVRAALGETSVTDDIGRDTQIRIEGGSFVIVFKLISLDLRRPEAVRATFLMLKYPR